MSKRFKPQDYFRYKRLGKRWRKPVGWQSKMRLQKAGAGLVPGIGYGTEGKLTAVLVRNAKDLEKDCRYGIIFAGSLGARKTAALTELAKEKGITILNMKKVKRAKKIAKTIASKKEVKKDHKHKEEKKEEHKVKEHDEQKEHSHEGHGHDHKHPHESHVHHAEEHKHKEEAKGEKKDGE